VDPHPSSDVKLETEWGAFPAGASTFESTSQEVSQPRSLEMVARTIAENSASTLLLSERWGSSSDAKRVRMRRLPPASSVTFRVTFLRDLETIF